MKDDSFDIHNELINIQESIEKVRDKLDVDKDSLPLIIGMKTLNYLVDDLIKIKQT